MKKYLTFLCISLFVLFNVFISLGQNFEKFSNKEGFNQNTINTIEQDKHGFLWFGTPNGLIKYDGYEFETFTAQSNTNGAISSNNLTSLHNDSNGVLWIGTNVGMNVYIPWLERFYTVPLNSKLEVSHIISSPNGAVWFSCENKLFYCKLKNAEKGVFTVSENLLTNSSNVLTIKNFSFIDENELILATNAGVKKIELKHDKITNAIKVQLILNFDKFENTNIEVIKKLKNVFWIGTEKGLFKTTIVDNNILVVKVIVHIFGQVQEYKIKTGNC